MVLKPQNSKKFIGFYLAFINIFNFILLDIYAKILKTGSPAIGLMIAILVFIFTLFPLLSHFYISIKTQYIVVVLILINFICLHFFISTLIFKYMNFNKFIFSLIFLFGMFIIAVFL